MDYYLSPERLEELKKELEELKTVRRIEVAKRLNRAKDLGDLSENSEYQEARREQDEVERRIFELEQIVKNAKLIDEKATAGKGFVQIGSTLMVERNGASSKYKIVGSKEVDPASGLISNESPLGKALLGRKAGDVVKVKTPSGEKAYTIVSIE
jgi:transcription elongation factor GreA